VDEQKDLAAEKRREVQLRRVAAGMGLAVRKSRARDPMRMDYGMYRVENIAGDYVVTGKFPYNYSLTLDAVEEVLDELQAARDDEELRKAWEAVHGSSGSSDAKWRRGGR
jgi:hypothetical protein